MNCFSARKNQGRWLSGLLGLCVVVSACHADSDARKREYQLDFLLTPMPETGVVQVEMRVRQDQHWLREIEFGSDERLTSIAGDGEVTVDGGTVKWRVPKRSGTLSWNAQVDNLRGSSHDAFMDLGWAVFRAEDIIPRSSAITAIDAVSKTTVSFDLPTGWSVSTPYPSRAGVFQVDKAHRRLDLPAGWIAMGTLGTRIDTVGSTRVVVTGPADQGIRRLDMLALLRWNLPELERILPMPMRRLTIVSGGDPMWRGGLSAPTSLFIHADLPLISENGTSLLLHEVMHVAMNLQAADGHDWIQEGLAEYYSIELLRRSGTISARRYERAIDNARDWGQEIDRLCGAESTGAATAASVAIFHDLDNELRQETTSSIDDLFAAILGHGSAIDTLSVREYAETLLGSPSQVLTADILSNCND